MCGNTVRVGLSRKEADKNNGTRGARLDMVGIKKGLCSICRQNKNHLLSKDDHVVDKALSEIIENITKVKVQGIASIELLICAECAVSLVHASMIIEKLQSVLSVQCFKNTAPPSAKENEESERVNDSRGRISLATKDLCVPTTKSDFLFKCDFCEYQSRLVKIFKRHLLQKHEVTNPRIYKCALCPESYQRFNGWQNHFAFVHEKKPRMPQRRKTIASEMSTDGNFQIKLGGKRRASTEEMTDGNFPSPKKLKFDNSADITLEGDDGLESIHFKCDQDNCKYTTANPKIFKKHLLNKHKIEKPRIYKCTQCPSSYQMLYALRNHIAFVHENKPRKPMKSLKSVPPNCSDDTLFPDDAVLDDTSPPLGTPQKTPKSAKSSFKCEECLHVCETEKQLRKHILSEHDADTANEMNSSSNNHPQADGQEVVAPWKSKADWNFSCDFCNFETNKKKHFKSHQVSKHQINDERVYKCEYCPAAFEHFPKLASHMDNQHNYADEEHDEVHPPPCEKVIEANSQSADTSEGLKLSCRYADCGKTFSKPSKLRQHLVKKHGNFRNSISAEELTS